MVWGQAGLKLCWDPQMTGMRQGYISGPGDSRDGAPESQNHRIVGIAEIKSSPTAKHCVLGPVQGCGHSCLPVPTAPQGFYFYLLAEVDVAPRVLIKLIAIDQQCQDVKSHHAVCV